MEKIKNKNLNIKKNYHCDYYFGLPGCGKTTFAAYLARKYQRRNIDVFSNVVIKGCYAITREDIGHYEISNGLLIMDEAGIDYNNRGYKDKKYKEKAMSDEAITFYKYYRHNHLDVAFFSQSHDDVDVTLRRLCDRMYYVKKSLIPFFIVRREVCKKIDINKDTHQVEVQYYWRMFGRKRIFSPLVWKMFDSYSNYELPKKEFYKYR